MSPLVLVILSRTKTKDGSLSAIGSRAEVAYALSLCNTSADIEGGDVLYGPGIEIQLSPNQDPVLQMLFTVTDKDISQPVLKRLHQQLQWKLLDPETGDEYFPP